MIQTHLLVQHHATHVSNHTLTFLRPNTFAGSIYLLNQYRLIVCETFTQSQKFSAMTCQMFQYYRFGYLCSWSDDLYPWCCDIYSKIMLFILKILCFAFAVCHLYSRSCDLYLWSCVCIHDLVIYISDLIICTDDFVIGIGDLVICIGDLVIFSLAEELLIAKVNITAVKLPFLNLTFYQQIFKLYWRH